LLRAWVFAMLDEEEVELNEVDDWEALGVELANNGGTKTLDLTGSNLTNEGAAFLAEGLKMNTALHTLILESASIEDEGAGSLFAALVANEGLKSLNLRGNNLGEPALESLIAALQLNGTLQVINLENNPLEDVNILIWMKLAATIQKNTSLHDLRIEATEERAAPLAMITKSTKRNRAAARATASERLNQIRQMQADKKAQEAKDSDKEKSRKSMSSFFEGPSAEEAEINELKRLMKTGAPSYRANSASSSSAGQEYSLPNEDYMTSFARRYQEEKRQGNVKPWEMKVRDASKPKSTAAATETYMMSHVKEVRAKTPNSKARPQASPDQPNTQPSLVGTDSYMAKHASQVRNATVRTFKGTKTYGVAPKGNQNGSFLMLHVQQVINDKKKADSGARTCYEMAPHVQPNSVHMEFVKQLEKEKRRKEFSHVGAAPKMTARAYMSAHTKSVEKVKSELKNSTSSIGMPSNLPPETYMHDHVKKVGKKMVRTHVAASDSADSFLNSFVAQKKKFETEVKQKEREEQKPVEGTAASFLDSYLGKIREESSKRPEGSVGGYMVGTKPTFSTDEFTLAVHLEAQREVTAL